ncbi:molybdopterin-dependent oxidoreductase [Shigella flexneri]
MRWIKSLLPALLKHWKTASPYQHNGMNRHFPDIRFISWRCQLTDHQDTNRLIRAWQKPGLVVISEISVTAAAKHADIIILHYLF